MNEFANQTLLVRKLSLQNSGDVATLRGQSKKRNLKENGPKDKKSDRLI